MAHWGYCCVKFGINDGSVSTRHEEWVVPANIWEARHVCQLCRKILGPHGHVESPGRQGDE